MARGDVIAEVGETGFARAPHLHFELHERGHPRDPMRRIRRETIHRGDDDASAEDVELAEDADAEDAGEDVADGADADE